ncbi:hypothetical protein D3C74_275110 [compost metagenome]
MKHWKIGLLSSVIYLVIAYTWRFYEVWMYGEVMPDMFDSIIAFILSVSLTLNVFMFRDLIKGDKEAKEYE